MNLMTSVITNDITMTTIEKYIISAINIIKSKKQRADESFISDYILRNFQTNVSKSDTVERIEILRRNNTIVMVKLPKKSMKKKLLTMWIFKVQLNLIILLAALLTNVNNNLEFLNLPTSPMQVTTPLLTTKHCDFEIIALKEQTERQNIEIQGLKELKEFFKEQVYILKKWLEELANPVNNNESL